VLAEGPPGVPDLAGGALRLHVVGVGGAAMNAIATVLVAMGHRVSGSDAQASPVLERLESLGVRTYLGHDAANVGGADVVTFSTAVKADNPELVEARSRAIPTVPRAEILRAICRTRRTLAVSGTHGKTTTTAMLAAVLADAGLDPGFIVGGELPGARGGAHWGGGEWFVVEADESDGTFLRLGAEGVVVTSIGADHLDHFGDVAGLTAAFAEFVRQAPGPKVVCLDDPGAAALCSVGKAPGPGMITYGTAPSAAYRVSEVEFEGTSACFEVRTGDVSLGRFSVPAPGMHNVLDATAALAMACAVGVGTQVARSALAHYRPVRRRFELRGSRNGITYVDDYAHNPGKVRAALAGARQGGWQRVVAVFQPHRYSRTLSLWQSFADAFVDADVLVLTGIYPAGEAAVPGVSGRLVADAVRAAHPSLPLQYVETRDELVEVLRGLLRPGDLCLTMGAGDLTTLPGVLLAGPEGGGTDEEIR